MKIIERHLAYIKMEGAASFTIDLCVNVIPARAAIRKKKHQDWGGHSLPGVGGGRPRCSTAVGLPVCLWLDFI